MKPGIEMGFPGMSSVFQSHYRSDGATKNEMGLFA